MGAKVSLSGYEGRCLYSSGAYMWIYRVLPFAHGILVTEIVRRLWGNVTPTFNLIYKFEICYKFEMRTLMNSGSINLRKTYMTSSFPSREKCVIYGSETVLRQGHVIKLAINFNQLHLKSAITDQSFDLIPHRVNTTTSFFKLKSKEIKKSHMTNHIVFLLFIYFLFLIFICLLCNFFKNYSQRVGITQLSWWKTRFPNLLLNSW